MAGNRGYDVVVDIDAEASSHTTINIPRANLCRATSATPTSKKISNSTTPVRGIALHSSTD
jgi:hypothetical protein